MKSALVDCLCVQWTCLGNWKFLLFEVHLLCQKEKASHWLCGFYQGQVSILRPRTHVQQSLLQEHKFSLSLDWTSILLLCFYSVLFSIFFLIMIRSIFTMYQEIIYYNLHRNPFKGFVHLPLVDFRGRRDAKWELCKSVSTPGGIKC